LKPKLGNLRLDALTVSVNRGNSVRIALGHGNGVEFLKIRDRGLEVGPCLDGRTHSIQFSKGGRGTLRVIPEVRILRNFFKAFDLYPFSGEVKDAPGTA